MSRVHAYGKALGDFRNSDPLVMEVAAVDQRGSVTSTGNVSKMTSLARIELTNEEPQWFEWDVYMEAGYEPEIRFRNGPMSAKRMVRLLTTKAADKPEFKPFVIIYLVDATLCSTTTTAGRRQGAAGGDVRDGGSRAA
mgnify:CR=1 FL=1